MAQAYTYRPARVLTPLLLGVFLRALQMTVIAPSLLSIAQSLSASLADVGWIMAIYATGSLIAQPIAGRMSDVQGRRRVFIAALAIFMAGSLACALATSLGWLVAARVVQSLGAGGLQPAAIALIGQRVPVERQSSALYALYGMFALAGALGSALGGAIIDGGRALGSALPVNLVLHHELVAYPWHLIFWLNVPIAAVALALALRLPLDDVRKAGVSLDSGAIILIPVAAFSLMMAANSGGQSFLYWLVAALGALVALALWEQRSNNPFFEPALFQQRGPVLLFTIAILTGVPIFSVTMYSAAYFMAQFNASAAQAGVALLALALPLGGGQGVGSRLSRKLGDRAMLVFGLAALCAGELCLAMVQSFAGVLVAFAIIGFGIGLASAPPNALVLRYVDPGQSGAATGLLTMLSSAGAITAPALVSAILHASSLPTAQSFRLEFALACGFAVLAIPFAVALPRPSQLAHAHACAEGRTREAPEAGT